MLKDVINEFEDSIEFRNQENDDVEKFFYEELECKNVPEGVIEFYKDYDGCSLSINEIFSLEDIKNEVSEFFDDFLKGMGIDFSEYKYIPIADDGMGGYYAFNADNDDETIYYLDHEFPDEIQSYENFEDFLNELCNMDTEI